MTAPATTEPGQPPEPDTTATDATNTDANAPHEGDAQQEPDRSGNSEAARWRVKLRETEAERDALAERVTGFHRRDAERLVEDVLAQPADLWDVGRADVAEFLDDEGNLLEDEVRAAAAALLEQRPGLAKIEAQPPGPRQWGQSGGMPPAGTGWAPSSGRGKRYTRVDVGATAGPGRRQRESVESAA